MSLAAAQLPTALQLFACAASLPAIWPKPGIRARIDSAWPTRGFELLAGFASRRD